MTLGQGKYLHRSEALLEGSRQVGSYRPERLLQGWLLHSGTGSAQLTARPTGWPGGRALVPQGSHQRGCENTVTSTPSASPLLPGPESKWLFTEPVSKQSLNEVWNQPTGLLRLQENRPEPERPWGQTTLKMTPRQALHVLSQVTWLSRLRALHSQVPLKPVRTPHPGALLPAHLTLTCSDVLAVEGSQLSHPVRMGFSHGHPPYVSTALIQWRFQGKQDWYGGRLWRATPPPLWL